jgi:CxxC motif-containing protein
MKEAMKELKSVSVCSPVKMGDVVLKDVAGTGVDVIASRSWAE